MSVGNPEYMVGSGSVSVYIRLELSPIHGA